MNSLADAIVMQNLSVLTRGNTLRHKVLLLGGPNTYLPFLRDCWRKRIPETWRDRGYDYPKDVPIEELIIVPENAQYYAAYGAVMYGLYEAAERRRLQGDGRAQGLHPQRARRAARRDRGPAAADPGRGQGKAELDEFREALHASRSSRDAKFEPGQVVTRRHRHGRRLDVVEGRAHRLRHGRAAQEGVHALQGQPDRRHQGDPGAASRSTSPTRARSSRSWASAPPATPPTCSRSR